MVQTVIEAALSVIHSSEPPIRETCYRSLGIIIGNPVVEEGNEMKLQLINEIFSSLNDECLQDESFSSALSLATALGIDYISNNSNLISEEYLQTIMKVSLHCYNKLSDHNLESIFTLLNQHTDLFGETISDAFLLISMSLSDLLED